MSGKLISNLKLLFPLLILFNFVIMAVIISVPKKHASVFKFKVKSFSIKRFLIKSVKRDYYFSKFKNIILYRTVQCRTEVDLKNLNNFLVSAI